MTTFEYATREGGEEVALLLGVSVDEMMNCQDWEYTFPKVDDLSRYQAIYDRKEVSDLAKRVLGCFIFESLEGYLRAGGSESIVQIGLKRLAQDFYIHKEEFHDWALYDDEHYDLHPEDGWSLMPIVRDLLLEAENETDCN